MGQRQLEERFNDIVESNFKLSSDGLKKVEPLSPFFSPTFNRVYLDHVYNIQRSSDITDNLLELSQDDLIKILPILEYLLEENNLKNEAKKSYFGSNLENFENKNLGDLHSNLTKTTALKCAYLSSVKTLYKHKSLGNQNE